MWFFQAGEGDEEDELPVKTDIDVNIPLTKTEYESPFPPIKVARHDNTLVLITALLGAGSPFC